MTINAKTLQWNKEWEMYFSTEGTKVFKEDFSDPTLPQVKDFLTNLPSDNLLDVVQAFIPLQFVKNKTVCEIGCGCGGLTKKLAYVAKSVLGVEYSTVALEVAKTVSPGNVEYITLSTLAEKMGQYFEKFNCIVSRNFYIHQNLKSLHPLLELSYKILKPGGKLIADFYSHIEDYSNPWAKDCPVNYSDPNTEAATSSVYLYNDESIKQITSSKNFRLVGNIERDKKIPRKYAVLEK